jgi:hypothetical protein
MAAISHLTGPLCRLRLVVEAPALRRDVLTECLADGRLRADDVKRGLRNRRRKHGLS